MVDLHSTVSRFQEKIGAYDKQQWERSVETKNPSTLPMKTGRIRKELIDMDLVSGSTFTKAKPANTWPILTRRGFIRVVFFPFFYKWWTTVTSFKVWLILCCLYFLQLLSLFLYFTHNSKDMQKITLTEVCGPLVLMLVLGTIYFQLVSTSHSSTRPTKVSRLKQQRSRQPACSSQNRPKQYKKLPKQDSPSSTSRRTPEPETTDKHTKESKASSGGDASHASRAPSPHSANSNPDRDPDPTPEGEDSPDHLDMGGVAAYVGGEGDEITNCLCEDRKMLDKPIESEEHVGQILVPGNEVEDSIPAVVFQDLRIPEDGWNVLEEPDLITQHLQQTMSTDGEEGRGGKSDIESGQQNGDGFELDGKLDTVEEESEPSSVDEALSDQENSSHGFNDGSWDCVDDYKCMQSKKKQSNLLSSEEKGRSSTEEGGDIHESDIEETASWTDTDGDISETTETDSEDTAEENQSEENESPFEGVEKASSTPHIAIDSTDKVCIRLWEDQEWKKGEMSMLEISSVITNKVDHTKHNLDYFFAGFLLSLLLALLPISHRLHTVSPSEFSTSVISTWILDSLHSAISNAWMTQFLVIVGLVERWVLSGCFFFLLGVVERTYRQRVLLAKYFCHLTSARKARKSQLPHFRLHKVPNIKAWLSIRSYMKRIGPQHSVDVIVSSAFLLALCLLSIMCVQLMKSSESFFSHLYNWEMVAWCLCLGLYLLRFITLGSQINRKYKNTSLLLTEQINLYLHMEQKPHKKEELMLANSVLKLATKLLKELESPFKVSGLSMNPLLYNITRVIVLSAFSGVMTEILGFKLKLWKIKA